MSKGKWESKKAFNAKRYTDRAKELKLTDRQVCQEIKNLHIVISKDPLYPGDPEKDNIVTCTPQHLSNAKKSGYLSPSILNALGKVLNVAPEYLSGEISDADLQFWFDSAPSFQFHRRQEIKNLSKDTKEMCFEYELFDLGIYEEWMKMDTKQRNYCHTAIYEFSHWLLNYVDPDKEGYEEIFDFFSKTGVTMDPDLRKELFKTLTVTYKTFMQMHTKK